MRKLITPGEKIYAYCCPFCGQVEILTESEARKECSNCGTEMLPAEDLSTKPVTFGSEKENQEKQAEIDKLCGIIAERPPHYIVPPATPDPELDKGTPPAPAPKKKGRPPKKPETLPLPHGEENCSNCAKALTATNGYTCKETCEAVAKYDWCPKHTPGKPVE